MNIPNILHSGDSPTTNNLPPLDPSLSINISNYAALNPEIIKEKSKVAVIERFPDNGADNDKNVIPAIVTSLGLGDRLDAERKMDNS